MFILALGSLKPRVETAGTFVRMNWEFGGALHLANNVKTTVRNKQFNLDTQNVPLTRLGRF
jgi:hypothetical protein